MRQLFHWLLCDELDEHKELCKTHAGSPQGTLFWLCMCKRCDKVWTECFPRVDRHG